MLSKVFLNILGGSLSFPNAVQCWAMGFRLYFLLIISLYIDGQNFLNKIYGSISFTNDVQCLQEILDFIRYS